MAQRTAQKNRTRAALLATARELMVSGEEVSLARVAEAAQISRATVYRYYSDPGTLSAEATLDIELKPTHELLGGLQDTRQRVHAVAQYYLEFTREHEALFRQFLAQTMRQWSAQSGSQLRGGRRIQAFTEALDPVRPLMEPDAHEELVFRLSMLTGLEQHIAISDVLRQDEETGNRLQAGLVDAVLDRYLPQS